MLNHKFSEMNNKKYGPDEFDIVHLLTMYLNLEASKNGQNPVNEVDVLTKLNKTNTTSMDPKDLLKKLRNIEDDEEKDTLTMLQKIYNEEISPIKRSSKIIRRKYSKDDFEIMQTISVCSEEFKELSNENNLEISM